MHIHLCALQVYLHCTILVLIQFSSISCIFDAASIVCSVLSSLVKPVCSTFDLRTLAYFIMPQPIPFLSLLFRSDLDSVCSADGMSLFTFRFTQSSFLHHEFLEGFPMGGREGSLTKLQGGGGISNQLSNTTRFTSEYDITLQTNGFIASNVTASATHFEDRRVFR